MKALRPRCTDQSGCDIVHQQVKDGPVRCQGGQVGQDPVVVIDQNSKLICGHCDVAALQSDGGAAVLAGGL